MKSSKYLTENEMPPQRQIKLHPIQCRMARAALNINIEALSGRTGVSANTISRLENEDVDVGDDAIERLLADFKTAGLQMISENGMGLGVRLLRPTIHLLRKPSWHPFYERLAFIVGYNGQKFAVHVSRDILDDLDRYTGKREPKGYFQSFEKNYSLIMQACEKAIADGAVQQSGHMYLRRGDFAESVV